MPRRVWGTRGRLDAVALGTGDVGLSEIALAGLATAIGLPPFIYPGFGGLAARRRVARAGHGARSAAAMTQPASTALADATDVATSAAADAVRASMDAAVQASIDAATQAAISAATDAAHSAHHAAGGGGHAGGHH